MQPSLLDRLRLSGNTPRPFVAFAVTTKKRAVYLYRAQNLIWIWLGCAAVISSITYLFRPKLGVVPTTNSPVLDISREGLFAVGGLFISIGVWSVHRQIEIGGHIFFATGALLNTISTLMIHGITTGAHIVGTITILGVAFASGFRAYFIVIWIGADVYTHPPDPS